MADSYSKTEEVLAAARKELEAQLARVREQIARLAAEEAALIHAVSSLDGGNPATSPAGKVTKRGARSGTAKSETGKRSARKTGSGRRRRGRGTTKSTAERVSELRGLLADGPRSRADLAAALKVSPARVQQLLAELGSAVSSQPDPGERRGKLWSLRGGNGGSAKATAGRATASASGASGGRSSARRAQSAK